jgi:hypothetical protein
VGIFVIPPLTGRVRTLTEGYSWPFRMMAAVAVTGVVLALILRAGGHTRRFKWSGTS